MSEGRFTVTSAWIHEYGTPRGGWTRQQLAVIGVDWPPRSGWLASVCGKQISAALKERFEELHRQRAHEEAGGTHERQWMVAVEAQFNALAHSDKYWAASVAPAQSNALKRALRQADCYYWTNEMWTGVTSAAGALPGQSTLAHVALPSNTAWMYLGPEHRLFEALLYFRTSPDHILGALFRRTESQDLVPFAAFAWGQEKSLDDLRNNEDDQGASLDELEVCVAGARFLICAAAWLQQRILVTSAGHIERHRRKQIAREHDAIVSDVKVVQLRRRESSQGASASDGVSPDWSCRWIVNGHWRNQYHPSSGKRELLYILPYVKGPDDKPLKVPSQTVYSVSR